MSSGTVGVTEALLGPAALPPPPMRHALLTIVIALAALLHLGALGWGDLYSETEGQYAGAAREMLQSGQFVLPTNDGIPRLQKPPLLYWLIIVSYRCCGINAPAARLPIALSIVVTTALTFLLGERLSGFWRGFSASLIFLTLSGTFVFGRMVMPEPLFGAFITGAFYCAVAGFQDRRARLRWYAGFWICAALACLTKGPHGLFIPGGTLLILALIFRDARLRFRALLWWPYLLLFAAIVIPWYGWIEAHLHGSFHRLVAEEWTKHLLGRSANGEAFDDVPRWRFLLLHLGWWFPWSIALLPALLLRWRYVIRPRELTLPDLLPVVWLGVVFLPVLLIGQRQDYYAFTAFGGFALFAAMIWERMARDLQVSAAVTMAILAVVVGVIAVALPHLRSAGSTWGGMDYRFTAWQALERMPSAIWMQFRPMLALTALSLLLGGAITFYLVQTKQEKLAVLGLALGMLPIGFSMAQGVARVSPYFSLAEAARFLNSRLGPEGQVLLEAPPGIASSLGFYLDRKFALVNQAPEERLPLTKEQRRLFLSEETALQQLAQSHPVFLLIEQDRVEHWRDRLTERFHVYHQVATCGTYVILTNQL